MSKDNAQQVEIYHRINKLRLKAGLPVRGPSGVIDPSTIKKAQTHITTLLEYRTESKYIIHMLQTTFLVLHSYPRYDNLCVNQPK